ncbi:MAG: hypothetical protein U0Y08_04770 [Bacteroidia bacterium]
MKYLLKLFLIAGLILSAAGVNAQNQRPAKRTPPTPEVRAERRTAMLKDKLLLTEEQKTKVYDALLKFEKSRVTDQQQIKANREAYEAELRTILTPEQLEKYEAMREERKAEIKKKAEENRNQEKLKQEKTDNAAQPAEQR